MADPPRTRQHAHWRPEGVPLEAQAEQGEKGRKR